MPAPIELALASLVPTISFLPPDLITLSNSLLSQSRAKAASLKPEEEIGRTYACCHIACERLRRRLDLEVGRPAPPVKPRVYDKLYRYLDGVLAMPVTRAGVRTPTKDRAKDGSGRGEKSGSAARGKDIEKPTVRTPTRGAKRTRDVVDGATAAPEFVMPMVRAICKANGTPLAVPHVLVGATSVVQEIVSRANRRTTEDAPSKRRRRMPQSAKSAASSQAEVPSTGIPLSRWPALLIALYILIAARMYDMDTDGEEMELAKRKSVDAVRVFCEDTSNPLIKDLEVGTSELDANIGFYIVEGEDYGWLDMEWYQNVPLQANDAVHEDGMDNDADSDAERQMPTPRKRPHKTPLRRKEKHEGTALYEAANEVGAAGLLPGLGTMFQPAIDWLSEDRRLEFASWKKDILRQATAMEANA